MEEGQVRCCDQGVKGQGGDEKGEISRKPKKALEHKGEVIVGEAVAEVDVAEGGGVDDVEEEGPGVVQRAEEGDSFGCVEVKGPCAGRGIGMDGVEEIGGADEPRFLQSFLGVGRRRRPEVEEARKVSSGFKGEAVVGLVRDDLALGVDEVRSARDDTRIVGDDFDVKR